MLDTDIYAKRLEHARGLMHAHALDFLLVGPGADLLYLIGAHSRATERLTLLIVSQEGRPYIVLPAFEAATLPALPKDVQVRTWGETENTACIAAQIISATTGSQPGGADCTCGVADI